MTAPMMEPSTQGDIVSLGYRTRQLERRPAIVAAGGAVIYEIKVDPDDTTALTADDRHVFAIPSDLDGWFLTDAQGWVSTVGDDAAIVYIRNVTTTNDMLADPITIDAGDFTSYISGTPSSVEATYAEVSTGDLISVDVNVGVTPTCKGLGVILTFSPP